MMCGMVYFVLFLLFWPFFWQAFDIYTWNIVYERASEAAKKEIQISNHMKCIVAKMLDSSNCFYCLHACKTIQMIFLLVIGTVIMQARNVERICG